MNILMSEYKLRTLSVTILVAVVAFAAAAAPDPQMVFENPPLSARTGVWWHWMGSNVTKAFDAYPGATLNERVEAYAHDCGFTPEDIAKFRSIMLVAAGIPRVWTSNGGMKDSAVFEKAVEDCRAHGIDVMNNGAAPSARICAERLSICRAHGMKLHVGVSDASKADKLAKDTGRYELAVMSGGCYKGLAIDRNLFSFTAAKHEIIVEPPVYSKGQPMPSIRITTCLATDITLVATFPRGRRKSSFPKNPLTAGSICVLFPQRLS